MASTLSRRICRSIFTNPIKPSSQTSLHKFCTDLSNSETSSDSEDPSVDLEKSDSETVAPSSPLPDSTEQRAFFDRPLQDGLDPGIYRAILVGQVGQSPIEKKLRGGRTVTLLSLGTGGIRNNRRPLQNEEPRDYANRSMVQWHRVSIYPEGLGAVVMKNAVPGSILYLEGNLETKIFNDPITGLVRRVREIAIRRSGRIVFLGQGGDAQQSSRTEMRGVGYY